MAMKSFFVLLLTCIAQHIDGSTIQPQPSSTVSTDSTITDSSCTCSSTSQIMVVNPSTLPTYEPDGRNGDTIGITSLTALLINPQFVKLDWTIKFISSFDRFNSESITNFRIHLAYDIPCRSTDETGSYGNVSSIPPPVSISVSSRLMHYTLGPLKSEQLYLIKLSLVLDESLNTNSDESYYYEDYWIVKSRNISVRMPACSLDCNEPKGIINLGCTSCTCKTNSYGGNHCKDPMFATTITYIAQMGQDALDIHWHHNYDLYSDIEITQFTVTVTDTRSNMTRETAPLTSNANRTIVGPLEEEVLYSIAIITDTTDDTVTSNALTAMIPNFVVLLPSSSVRILESPPAEAEETTNDAVGGIVVVVLIVFIISIHTCSPLVVIIFVQKRKIRQYEAQRAAVPEPLNYEREVQDGHGTLLSAYNIISHDNPSYVLSNSGNGSLPEYQNSRAPLASATNQLYASAEVDATSSEHEARSNTSTLTYDYVPRSIMQ